IELEHKRANARARAEEARAKARERVEQDMQQRQNLAVRSYQQRLRTVDPIWNQKYDTKPLGAVPDFNMLHMQWEQRMATLRALNRRRATVPYEFHVNGGDAEQRRAREQKDAGIEGAKVFEVHRSLHCASRAPTHVEEIDTGWSLPD
ncbi:hypothetical protein DUNSADRAFT_17795, partial [Dunaliella salina]